MLKKYFSFCSLFICVCLLSGCSTELNVNHEAFENSIPTTNNLILIIKTNGGCMMAGPNCPQYELFDDGRFDVYRSGETEITKKGEIDTELLKEWKAIVATTNFNQLINSLGKGECRACYDGVDHHYQIFFGSEEVSINSQEYSFDQSLEFFKLSQKIEMHMQQLAPLEMKFRGQ